MNSQRKSKKNREIEIESLYSVNPGAIWCALKSEHLSLWMLCAYFFFEYVRPQTLYPQLDILPWAQVFLIAALITAIIDPTVRWVGHSVNKLMILFAIVIILSGIFAFRPSASLDYWTAFGGWFLVYFLLINIINTEQRMILFLFAYCLFNLKMSQHGAVSWAMRGFSFTSYGLVGAPGWFRNSGEFAIQMLIFGSLAISIVVTFKNYWGRYKKWILYSVAATGYMAVMGASSRGAQIALVVIGIWWLTKLKGGLRGLLVLLMIAFALFFLLPDEQIQRLEEMGEDKSSLQRMAYWEYGIKEVIPRHPVIGVGYHNWLSYVRFKVPEGLGPISAVEEPHNILVQAASELGMLGLSVFLLLVLSAFLTNRNTRAIIKNTDNRLFVNLSYGLDAGMIGFLVAGMFVTVLYYPFFWIQLSMIVMANCVARRKYTT